MQAKVFQLLGFFTGAMLLAAAFSTEVSWQIVSSGQPYEPH